METLVTGEGNTALVVSDDGQGQPLVFVHGSNGGLDSWSSVAAGLPGYRIIRYARRNHPPSAASMIPNTFAVEARDLQKILRVCGVTSAHVIGGSYGAMVALHAASQSTERIASLALFEPPILLAGSRLNPILERFEGLLEQKSYAEALEVFVRDVAMIPDEMLLGMPSPPSDPVAAASAHADLLAMAADTTDAARFSGVRVPVLLMQGGRSWSPLPEGMDELATALPHAHRVTWPDLTHFATAQAPQRVADTIRNFVTQTGG